LITGLLWQIRNGLKAVSFICLYCCSYWWWGNSSTVSKGS